MLPTIYQRTSWRRSRRSYLTRELLATESVQSCHSMSRSTAKLALHTCRVRSFNVCCTVRVVANVSVETVMTVSLLSRGSTHYYSCFCHPGRAVMFTYNFLGHSPHNGRLGLFPTQKQTYREKRKYNPNTIPRATVVGVKRNRHRVSNCSMVG